MTPRNGSSKTPTAEAEQGKTPAQKWIEDRLVAFRAWRAASTSPAVKPPQRPTLRPPRSSPLSSWIAARLAFRSGVTIEGFLQHRLAQRLGALPVAPERLPVSFAIADGGAVVQRPASQPAQRAPWLDSYLRAEGASALSCEIQLCQAAVARLAARIDAQRRQVEEVGRDLEEASRAAAPGDPGDEAQAEQMGRPPMPPPTGIGLQIFALVLLLAETWQLALPCLEAVGVSTYDLGRELQRSPVPVVLGGCFALGASLSLFLLAHLAFRRGTEALGAAEGRRRSWTATIALVAGALAAALAWCIAAAHPGASHVADPGYSRLMLFGVALAIPITAAWLARTGLELERTRALAAAKVRAWELEHFRTYAELSRRAAHLADEQKQLARLEAERTAAQRRQRALQQRAAAAQRLAADAADAEEQELARVAQAVAASLDLDRYEYMRVAGLRASARPADEVGHNLGLAS